MLRTLRLIPLLVVGTLVLILNPNRTSGLWLVVTGSTICMIVLSEVSFTVPETQTQARRRFLYLPFALFLVGQSILALVNGYDMKGALGIIALTTGPLVVSFLMVSGIRRLAR
jgi:hypothetical protein